MERAKSKLALTGAALLVGLVLAFWLNSLPAPVAQPRQSSGAEGHGFDHRSRRVVCMSPAVAEIVFALGAGDRVVGVSQYTTYPPEATRKPTCGGFMNPNYELILSLQPDLILTQGEAEKLTSFGRDNGIEVVSLELRDLASIFTETRRAGAALELEARAELLCAEMRYRLARVRAAVERKPRVPVVLVTSRDAGALSRISAVGPGGFLHDLIEAAGGRNVFADLPRAYAVVSKEAILERAPELVVELHGEGADLAAGAREARELWSGLSTLPAVRQGRVHVIEATYALIPGPRVVRLAERLAEIFHGDHSQ
ncbi:MAG: ABC transporter substrate-binding protein [Planctomycetota bacterium]